MTFNEYNVAPFTVTIHEPLNLTRLIYIEITWSGKEGASEKGSVSAIPCV
jgi:hypothetical protein